MSTLAKNKDCYRAGTARSLRIRKMTATSAMAAITIPGRPTSSAKPEVGRAVEVATTVPVDAETCVKPAPTVAVAGSGVSVNSSVLVADGCATTGVSVGKDVSVACGVWERLKDIAVAVKASLIVSAF